MTDPAGDLTDSRGYNLRVPMGQKIRLRFDGQGDFIVGVVVDLSAGGMAIECGFEPALGSMLRFVFRVPGSVVQVGGHGSVVWKRHSLETAGLTAVGVRFVPLAEVDREEVERIVRAEGGLKADLEQADAEVTRLRLVSEREKRNSSRELEEMRLSVRDNARARHELEEQLRKSGEFDLGTAEELLDLLSGPSADSEPDERADGRPEQKLRVEIDTLKATIAELECDDARSRLRETSFLRQAAELRAQGFGRSQGSLEREVDEARSGSGRTGGLAALLSAAESSAALQVLALESAADGALTAADERYRRLESAHSRLEEENSRLKEELSEVRGGHRPTHSGERVCQPSPSDPPP